MADNKTTSDIRLAAMNLLAMREHSAYELRKKLAPRFEGTDVTEAIAVLTEENLQSDARYTEAFITMRKRQGKGPVRIALELKEKGIGEALINLYLNTTDQDWFELAAAERHKRFGIPEPRDMKEKARQMRFLQYRGFTQPQISAAIKATE